MRYYHYVSQTKVDMLFPQIPKDFLHGVGVEIGFNFGLLSGKLSGKDEPPAERFAKVEAIERYLLSTMGTVDNEVKRWYKGTLVARLGGFADNPGLFLVCSKMGEQTRILAGSSSNLVSNLSGDGIHEGYSFMPRVLSSMQKYVDHEYDDYDASKDGEGMAETYIFGGSGIGGAMFHSLWELPTNASVGPLAEVEVLARIFLVDRKPGGKELVLGSPLYVADVD